MTQQLNIIGGFYADEARPWTQQDICNYIPFRAEQAGTLSPVIAVDAPGLKPFVEIASNGGIRGMENVEGKLLAVAGTTLYQISNAGVAIPRGTIPGTGLVAIGYNQAGIANEVLIGNGSAGYVYNTATLTLTRVTDEAFPGTKAVDYLDSYLLGVEPLGRFWFHSDLADADSYNSLDRYESETSPDRIVTLAVSNEEVVVFNQRTTDFFVNTGSGTGTFQSKGVSMTVGCASANSVVKLDNTLFWLDNFGVFQRLNGYSPMPVSTRVLESAISGFDWARCTATVYQDKGRKIVYWTFPDGFTIGYDVTTGMWHRREAYGLMRDRLSCIVNWGGKWLGGDYLNGRIYELDWDYMLQVDQPHVRKLRTAPLTAKRKRVKLSYLELVFDTGGPETIPAAFAVQPVGPSIAGNAPDTDIGDVYSFAYTVTPGDSDIASVTLQSGTLPAGLTLSSTGVITGTSTAFGSSTFTVRVTDVDGLWATVTDTIAVSPLWYAAGDGATGNKYGYGTTNGGDWNHALLTAIAGASKQYRFVMTSGPKIVLMSGSGGDGAYSSDKGVSFAEITGMNLNSAKAAAFDGSAFVVARNGGWVSRSAVGLTYTNVEIGNTHGDDGTKNLYCITHNSDVIVVGSSRSSISTDHGVTWTPFGTNYIFPAVASSSSGPNAYGIANDGETFVAGGAGNVFSMSSDGLVWTSIASPFAGTADITAVSFTAGRWIVGNASGAIAYGAAPTSLTVSAFNLGSAIWAINSRGGRTVIGGETGLMAETTDGVSWSLLTNSFGSGVTVQSIATPPESL